MTPDIMTHVFVVQQLATILTGGEERVCVGLTS
jgi:hypothetical protein